MAAAVESAAGRKEGIASAAHQLRIAGETRKCWACGCLRHALDTIEQALPDASRPHALTASIAEARSRLVSQRYDCLGCEVCYPAIALNALGAAIEGVGDVAACPTEAVEIRSGWPPLPGSYHVLRYRAPVAVCTLNSDQLAERIARAGG